MSTLTRHNLILALLAVVLSMALLLTTPEPAEDSVPISTLDPQSVSHIELALGRPGEAHLELNKTAAGWHLTHPVHLPADPMAVAEILRLASSHSSRSMPLDSLQLAPLQLDPPLWRIRFDDESFAVGGTEALSGQRYVLYGDKVYLVADLNPARLDNNYADLVVRDLLPDADSILSLRLPDAQKGSRDLPAADSNNSALTQRWSQTQAQWLVRPSTLDYDDVHARATVFLQDEKGLRYSVDFLIRSRSPRLELIRPDLDLMYMLPGSAAQELLSAQP